MSETNKKISEKDCIKLIIEEDNIEVAIKYPKQTTLKKRQEIVEKLKELLRKY